MRGRTVRFVCWTLWIGMLSGCAYPISKSLREEANPKLTLPVVQPDPSAYVGSLVIWGGRIIKTDNHPNHTDIIVLEMPLRYQEKPEDPSKSRGRFIARTAQFLDPDLFNKGRKITVAGKIEGAEKRPLGKTEYSYPVIQVSELHLWEKEHVVYYPPYYGWGWGWGWYSPLYEPWGPYDWYWEEEAGE
jgi:outer membrane lipoprotein